MKNKFFDLKYQNFFIKSLVVLASMIAVNLPLNMPLLFLGTLFYFLPFAKYLKFWLKSTLFLLPFFISYLILGMIFNTDFFEQLRFIIKIIFLVLMSVYFIKSLDVDRLLTDFKVLLRFNFIKKIMIFLIALIEITPFFYDSFQAKKEKVKKTNLSIAFHIFIKTFSEVFSKLDEIEIIVVEKMEDYTESKSALIMDLYSLIMFITLYFSIKY